MAKGDGLFIVLLGLISTIVSLFFLFFDTGATSYKGSDALVWMVQNISAYFNLIKNIGSFFPDQIFGLFIMINPLIFIIGALCVLIGMNGKSSATLGAVLLLIFPIVYLIFQVIIPLIDGVAFNTLFGYIQIGFYLQLVGSLLIIIGASKNGNYR